MIASRSDAIVFFGAGGTNVTSKSVPGAKP